MSLFTSFACGHPFTRCYSTFLKAQEESPTLVLAHARIGDEGAREIAEFASKSVHLRLLDLTGCGITSTGMLQIAEALQCSLTLESLILRHNEITSGPAGEEALASFCQAAQNSPSLRHLDLRYTGLCGEAATLHIASILEGNGALSHLELSWNPLGASAGQVLLKSIRSTSGLFDCQLSGCRLADETMKEIAELLVRNRRAHGEKTSVGPYKGSWIRNDAALEGFSDGKERAMPPGSRSQGQAAAANYPLRFAVANIPGNTVVSDAKTEELVERLFDWREKFLLESSGNDKAARVHEFLHPVSSMVAAVAVPPLDLGGMNVTPALAPIETLGGEVTYKLGGMFWPARCFARLHGDLLLIQRKGKQQAAVVLHGATVEFRAPTTVRIEAPGSPLLAIQLDTAEEAERWALALKQASKRSKGLKDLLSSDVVPLMLSPRSEQEEQEAEERLQSLRVRISEIEAEKDSTVKEVKQELEAQLVEAEAAVKEALKEADNAVCGRREAEQRAHLAEQATRTAEAEHQRHCKELEAAQDQLQEELREMRQKLDLEIASRKEVESKLELRDEELATAKSDLESLTDAHEAQIKLGQEHANKLDEQRRSLEALEAEKQSLLQQSESAVQLNSELQAKLSEEETSRKVSEDEKAASIERCQSLEQKVASLEAELEQSTSSAEACAKERAKLEASCKEAEASVTQHQQEISLLQRRIAAADTRFAAEVACRKAAEERSAGAERRLAETEELLEKALAERIAAQRRLIELEGGRKPSDVDIEVKQDQ
ncbi:Lrrc45 [Symbiodinium microadriaticum]|nr:Lrrc45 [Symbiodinium microadriaticum]